MQVIHNAREINLHSGTATVVSYLHQELTERGVQSSIRTSRWAAPLQHTKPKSRLLRKVWLALELVLYGVESLFFRSPKGAVVISHSDDLTGDIQVFHSCHKALVRRQLRSGNLRPLLDPVNYIVLLRQAIRSRLLRPSYIVAVSDATLAEVRREHPGLAKVPGRAIPNGVRVERFMVSDVEREEARRCVRSSYGVPSDAFLLVLVANRFPIKGVDTAIDAMPSLPDDVHLLVVGGDDRVPYVAQATRLGVSDRVHFAGHAPSPDPFYLAADAFVLPTRYEPFGIVGVEALAAGLPILMTPVGGIPGYLEDGVNGFFIRDAGDIVAKVTLLRGAPELRSQVAAAALASASRHSWSHRAEEYIEVIRQVAGSNGITEPL